MKNTLVQDNFEEISKLSNEDREVILTYFDNWTESLPSYFEDGETLQEKFETLFRCWLSDEKELDEDEIDDILFEYEDFIMEWSSNNEYNIQIVIDLYKGDWSNIYEELEELYDEYLN
jgi:hypothetical protein